MIIRKPMDIHVRIVKHVGSDGAAWYSSRLTIGRPDLSLTKECEEVFWCAATGKELPACIAAVKERALLWAKREEVRIIYGLLTQAGPCDLCLDPPPAVTILVPVTYNDWLTETRP